MKPQQQTPPPKQFCKYCGKEYEPKEVSRIFGSLSPILSGGYCSSACYTKVMIKESIPPTSTEYLNEKWKIDWVEGGGDLPIWNEKECVATVWLQSNTSEVAKLIAAAPQLAKALQMALERMNERADRNELEDEDVPVYQTILQVLKEAGLTE